jgi:uncharacterized membrane protein YfcA
VGSLTLAVSFLVAAIAAGIATWTGFGSATILTPVLASFLDLRAAILVVAIFHGLNNAFKVAGFFPDITWRVCLIFAPAAIACSVLGGLLSAVTPSHHLKVVLGLFLAVDASSGLIKKAGKRKWRTGVIHATLGGACSGFAAGIIGTGGAVRAFFLHHFLTEKKAYVGTSAAIAFLIDASRVPVYLTQYDDVNVTALMPLIAATVAAAFGGVFLAKSLLSKADTDQFAKLIQVSLFVAGAWFIVDGLGEWFG